MSSPVDTTASTGTVDANKGTVRALFQALTERRFADAAGLMTPDATWWMLSRRQPIPIALWLKGYERQTEPLFPDGLRFELLTLTAEADRVAAQAKCLGTTVTGQEYNNDYHFLFEFEGSLVRAAWEYGDTVHAQEIFG